MDVKITFDRYNVIEADKINDVKVVMVKGEKGDVGYPTDAQVETAVDEWLTAHPEATTTVQDGSITIPKLANDVKNEFDKKADAIVKSASGEIASFTDGGNGLLVKSLNVNITPKQSGSGEPSPSNVRPISGTDTVNVNVCGVNVWDEEWELGIFNTTTGANSYSASNIRSKNYIPVVPNATYYFKTSPNVWTNVWTIFFDADKNVIPNPPNPNNYNHYQNCISIGQEGGRDYGLYTIPSNCYFIRFYGQRAYGTTYNNDISINYPSTDHEYHAYQGTSYPISLGQTVYGGVLEVMSGKLTIDRAKIVLDGTQGIWLVNWVPTSNGVGWAYGYNLTQHKIVSDTTVPNIVSDKLKASSYGNMFNGRTTDCVGVYTNDSYGIFIRSSDTSLTTVEAINSYLSANPITVVYELATPTEITLTPTQVTTLLGNNNIWADSGTVEVEYRADTTLAYNELLSLIASL